MFGGGELLKDLAMVIVSVKPADSNRRLLCQAALKRTGCSFNPLQRVWHIRHRFQPVAQAMTNAKDLQSVTITGSL
jgi:hypothetical protein